MPTAQKLATGPDLLLVEAASPVASKIRHTHSDEEKKEAKKDWRQQQQRTSQPTP